MVKNLGLRWNIYLVFARLDWAKTTKCPNECHQSDHKCHTRLFLLTSFNVLLQHKITLKWAKKYFWSPFWLLANGYFCASWNNGFDWCWWSQTMVLIGADDLNDTTWSIRYLTNEVLVSISWYQNPVFMTSICH